MEQNKWMTVEEFEATAEPTWCWIYYKTIVPARGRVGVVFYGGHGDYTVDHVGNINRSRILSVMPIDKPKMPANGEGSR